MINSNLVKMLVRLLAMLLAVTILWGFAACTEREKPEEDTDQREIDDNAAETDDGGIASNVPESVKFENQEVFLWVANSEKSKNEVGAVEEPVGIINQAVVERNYNAEDRLGIVLTFVDQGTSGSQVELTRNIILTGGGRDGMDLVMGSAYYSATLASEGLLYNLRTDSEENYIEVHSPWYNQSFVEQCSFKNSLYWSVGDFNLTAYDRSPVTFLNEDALLDWSINEDLYQVALDGKWTVEYMQTLIKDVYEELDNDEGETKGDFYGLFFNSGSMCIDAMIVAVGINITTLNNDGLHDLTWDKGTAGDAFAKLYSLMYETSGVYLGTTGENTYNGELTEYYSQQAFFERRCLFSFGLLSAAQLYATDTALHYGMLPLPKYNELQNYQTTPQDGYTIVGIPSNAGERVGIASATLEIMSEFAYRTVRPVYFETAYKIRYASGEKTALLFDTVIDSVTFSFGMLYSNSLADPVHQLRLNLMNKSNASFASITKTFGPAVKLRLRDLLDKFENMSMVE